MLRFHTLVLTGDNSIKQGLRRLGIALSSTMEFLDSPSAFIPAPPLDLLIVDLRDARWSKTEGPLFKDLPQGTRQIYLIEDNALVERLDLLQQDSTASLICQRGELDEEELIATATKLLRGELFGLQKYLPWGVTTFTIEARSYDDKDRALRVMVDSAAQAGWRGPLRDRIELVCDELMMNALYHAPVDSSGQHRNAGKPVKDLVGVDLGPIQVQYGSSGRYFGVAVRDSFGSLTRAGLLSYLNRARVTPVQIEDKASGAGLGLVMVLRSASKLVFNLAPGNGTEVIALFDRELLSRGQGGARSLHVFIAPTIAPAPGSAPHRDSGSQREPGSLDSGGHLRARNSSGSLPTFNNERSSAATGDHEGSLTLSSRAWLLPLLILAAVISGLVVYHMMNQVPRPAPTNTAPATTGQAPPPAAAPGATGGVKRPG